MMILDQRGVVRQFQNLGDRDLPYRMKRHQEIHSVGKYSEFKRSYFSMLFDSSPATMIQLQNSLKKNENVIRHTVVKMGDSLSSISEYKDPREI